jgi:hypothetical protein
MPDGSSSRRGFFVTAAAAFGTALIPRAARAAVSSRPRKVVALPAEGTALIGRVRCELNETARFIYEQCDGRRSTDDMARALAEAFEIDIATARNDVVACLSQLRDLGAIR